MGDEEEMGEARDLDDENEDESNLVEDDKADTEDTEVEVVSSKDPQEIARFNNYMDAIYRRMNAALRAKLMDPMVLNMNAKVAKNEKKVKKDKKDKKKRVERSADLEEDD